MSGAVSFPLPHISHDLTGRVALVTGASSGLGHRFARTLAAAGADVVVAARRRDRLEELVADIESQGRRAQAVTLDVTDAASITAAVEAAIEGLGLPDVLVNNAGIPDARRAHRLDVELVDRVLGTNLRGPILLSVELGRRWIEAQVPGRIVNVSSMAAFYTTGGSAAVLYATTKSALNRLTESLALEWAPHGINVNAIAPGSFSSEMMDGMIERVGGDFSDRFPRRRMGDPAQLDSTLLYLLSPASDMVTGTVIRVDDGQCPR